MSHSKFLQIVEPSNKYQKIKKQTAIKLTLDKINVLKVVQSLIDFNRKLLKQQNIEEQVDDYIFMNISLQNASDFPNETPIQIKLPNPIYHIDNQNKTEALLIVKEKPEIYTQMCADLDFPSIVHIKTVTEIKKECADGKANVVKKFLNKFDLMLMDDRLAMTSIAKVLGGSDTLIKKRHFPMPVKIHGLDHQHFKKNIQEAFNSVGLLLTPSIEFIFKCGKTESMSNKEIVKNVINCAHKAVCLIMYSQRKIKHNKVKVISLQTTQSLALPIYEIGQDDANIAKIKCLIQSIILLTLFFISSNQKDNCNRKKIFKLYYKQKIDQKCNINVIYFQKILLNLLNYAFLKNLFQRKFTTQN